MIAAAAAAAALLLLTPVDAVLTSPAWSAGATSAGKSTTITVQATIAANQWVGIGFPDPANVGMGGADLVLLWANSTGVVQLLHSTGNTDGPDGLASVPSSDTEVALIPSSSSYTNGILTAVFTRDLMGSTNGIVIAPTLANEQYLWAKGSLDSSGKTPLQHDSKGIIGGVLEGAVPTITPSAAASATPTPPPAASVSVSINRGALGNAAASSMGGVQALALCSALVIAAVVAL